MKSLAAFAFIVGLFAAPECFAGPKMVAKVDLSEQRMRVYIDGRRYYTWRVSTGRRGYSTPTGRWKPKFLKRMHYSRKYDNAPMPWSVFYHGGYAIHGTNAIRRLGRRASHGCIRLHPRNAREFYAMVKYFGRNSTRIVVTR